MQTVKSILKLSGGNAQICDLTGRKSDIPNVKIGIGCALEFDLRCDQMDETTGELQIYPFEELQDAVSFYLCVDGDWDHATQPALFVTENITLKQSDDKKTLLRCELPNTALPNLIEAVQQKEKITLGCEICGFAVDGSAAAAIFAFDFDLVLRNRRYIGNTVPDSVISDPEYLTAVEIKALIAEATRPVQSPGKPGKSAYELALDSGFKGSLEEYLASLIGPPGDDAEGKPGKSAYELALDNGFEGSVQEFLAELKGEPGQGLFYDVNGSAVEKSLYDNRPAGFKFATATADAVSGTTVLYIYTKLSDDYADWSEALAIVFYGQNKAPEVVSVAPVEFTAPPENAAYFAVALTDYPDATVAAVTIDTADGEFTLPYYSDMGIRKILKKDGAIYIYFGKNVQAFSRGKVYLTQMVASSGRQVGNTPDVPVITGDMYYGYIVNDTMTSIVQIDDNNLLQSTLAKVSAQAVGRVDLGNVPAGTFTTVLLPNALKAYKDDGFGGKVPFELNNGIAGSGANGTTVTLGGVEYNVYGEFNLVAGKTIIYIEE